MVDSKLALWLHQIFCEQFVATLVSTSILALAVLWCYLSSHWAVQKRLTEHTDDTNSDRPVVVQDHQKALYHMVKFSIRLRRKLKRIREQQQSPLSSLCSQ